MLEKIGLIHCADAEFFIELLDECIAQLFLVREKFKREEEANDEF